MRISDGSSDVCSSDLEPAVVHLHVAVGVEGRPVDGDAEVLVDHDVLERPGPRRLVRALQLDLRLGASVAREDPGGAHGVGEEPKDRSEEHTSELQSLMRISYAVFCLKKKKIIDT